MEISGVRIAANCKTRAFVIQSGEDYIHGRFREDVITRTNAAQIPKDHRFILHKTMRRNYATDRASTECLFWYSGKDMPLPHGQGMAASGYGLW